MKKIRHILIVTIGFMLLGLRVFSQGGKISLVNTGNNHYSIQPDYYDFNIEWDKGFTKRNIATFGAGLLHYGVNPISPIYPIVPLIFGGPFWINFQGTVTIKP